MNGGTGAEIFLEVIAKRPNEMCLYLENKLGISLGLNIVTQVKDHLRQMCSTGDRLISLF